MKILKHLGFILFLAMLPEAIGLGLFGLYHLFSVQNTSPLSFAAFLLPIAIGFLAIQMPKEPQKIKWIYTVLYLPYTLYIGLGFAMALGT